MAFACFGRRSSQDSNASSSGRAGELALRCALAVMALVNMTLMHVMHSEVVVSLSMHVRDSSSAPAMESQSTLILKMMNKVWEMH